MTTLFYLKCLCCKGSWELSPVAGIEETPGMDRKYLAAHALPRLAMCAEV